MPSLSLTKAANYAVLLDDAQAAGKKEIVEKLEVNEFVDKECTKQLADLL